MKKKKPKIAIACQGGGSQTAFTAGVLKVLFENDVQKHVDIVSLSGTSGGCLCAALIWYALKKGDRVVWKRLIDFWEDNTAKTPAELAFNNSAVDTLRKINRGQLPQFNLSPSSPLMQGILAIATVGLRRTFTDFRALLEAHFDFEEIKRWGPQPDPPLLLLGAANVLTGAMEKFNSHEVPLRVEHILASCAVPNVFPAVEFDGSAYWDGLFSDNPPIDEMVRAKVVGAENVPNEVWVIKINPTTVRAVPTTPDGILDRHNELTGNMSLFHQLAMVDVIDDLILRGAFRDEFLRQLDIHEPIKIPKCFADDPDRPYHIPFIEMSPELEAVLDYESKLDRSPENIGVLLADGEKQGKKFLEQHISRNP